MINRGLMRAFVVMFIGVIVLSVVIILSDSIVHPATAAGEPTWEAVTGCRTLTNPDYPATKRYKLMLPESYTATYTNGKCFLISGSNIEFDMGLRALSAPFPRQDGYALYIEDSINVVVRNGLLMFHQNGIKVVNSREVTLSKISVIASTGEQIKLYKCENCKVLNSEIDPYNSVTPKESGTGESGGIAIHFGKDNELRDNKIDNSAIGIKIYGSNGNKILDNNQIVAKAGIDYHLFDESTGIKMIDSNFNIINGNTIKARQAIDLLTEFQLFLDDEDESVLPNEDGKKVYIGQNTESNENQIINNKITGYEGIYIDGWENPIIPGIFYFPQKNIIKNNIINATVPLFGMGESLPSGGFQLRPNNNTWNNEPLISGKNIIGTNFLGGNYYTRPGSQPGFSDNPNYCPDKIGLLTSSNSPDGICDKPFNVEDFGDISYNQITSCEGKQNCDKYPLAKPNCGKGKVSSKCFIGEKIVFTRIPPVTVGDPLLDERINENIGACFEKGIAEGEAGCVLNSEGGSYNDFFAWIDESNGVRLDMDWFNGHMVMSLVDPVNLGNVQAEWSLETGNTCSGTKTAQVILNDYGDVTPPEDAVVSYVSDTRDYCTIPKHQTASSTNYVDSLSEFQTTLEEMTTT